MRPTRPLRFTVAWAAVSWAIVRATEAYRGAKSRYRRQASSNARLYRSSSRCLCFSARSRAFARRPGFFFPPLDLVKDLAGAENPQGLGVSLAALEKDPVRAPPFDLAGPEGVPSGHEDPVPGEGDVLEFRVPIPFALLRVPDLQSPRLDGSVGSSSGFVHGAIQASDLHTRYFLWTSPRSSFDLIERARSDRRADQPSPRRHGRASACPCPCRKQHRPHPVVRNKR